MDERQISIINKIIGDILEAKERLADKKPTDSTYEDYRLQYRATMAKLEVILEFMGEKNVVKRAAELVKIGYIAEPLKASA